MGLYDIPAFKEQQAQQELLRAGDIKGLAERRKGVGGTMGGGGGSSQQSRDEAVAAEAARQAAVIKARRVAEEESRRQAAAEVKARKVAEAKRTQEERAEVSKQAREQRKEYAQYIREQAAIAGVSTDVYARRVRKKEIKFKPTSKKLEDLEVKDNNLINITGIGMVERLPTTEEFRAKSKVDIIGQPEGRLEKGLFKIERKIKEKQTKRLRGKPDILGEAALGFSIPFLQTAVFGKSLLTKPVSTIKSIPSGVRSGVGGSIKSVKSGEFARSLKSSGFELPARIAGEVALLKGTSVVITKTPTFVAKVRPSTKPIKKLDTPLGIERVITRVKDIGGTGEIGIIPSGKVPTAKTSKAMGKLSPTLRGGFGFTTKEQKIISAQKSEGAAVSSAADLFKKRTKEVVIEKPLFATPSIEGRGFARESRLPLQKEASILDIFSGDITFRRTKPQIVAFQEAKGFKGIGFKSSELETVSPIGTTFERAGKSQRTIIKGQVVEIIPARLKGTSSIIQFKETPSTLKLRKKSPIRISTSTQTIRVKPFVPKTTPLTLATRFRGISRSMGLSPLTKSTISPHTIKLTPRTPILPTKPSPPTRPIKKTIPTSPTLKSPFITPRARPPIRQKKLVRYPLAARLFSPQQIGSVLRRRLTKRRAFKPPARSPSLLAITQQIRATRPARLERSSLVVRPILTKKRVKKSGKKKK